MSDLENIDLTLTVDSHNEWTKIFVKVANLFCIYYTFFLLVTGAVCNSLSFIVLSRRSFRSTNLSLQLRILSVSDTANLVNMFLVIFLLRAYNVDITSNRIVCQLFFFYRHIPMFFSSWLLVIVTADRVVSIQRPHRHHILCSQGVVKRVLVATVVIISLISLLPGLTFGDTVVIETKSNTSTVLHCQAVFQDKAFSQGLLTLIILIFALVPSLLLVVLNIFIVVGVVKSRKSVMRKSNARLAVRSEDTTCISTITMRSRESNVPQSSTRDRISRREASLTKTVLAINMTFIFCNFPVCVFNFIPQYTCMSGEMGLVGVAIRDVLLALMYTNNAMNFVLYCVIGSKFRSEVRAFCYDIIQCCCPIWCTCWRR